jgi:8-oxo-dGTP pyrophosphatase MutT (NUDIX family)
MEWRRVNSVRNASTVILLRDGKSGVEVFMLKRHLKSDFVGGAHVFPGGVLDPDDEVDERLCAGHTDESASAALGVARGGLGYWVAAIRECFEESGVLLMYDAAGQILDFGDPAIEERYRDYREQLNQGRLSISDLARREGLKLATDRVHYWAHWITPEGQPRRYDTRFFLTVAPRRQAAVHDGSELTDSSWVTPQEALEKARNKEWLVIFPTLRNLELLRDFRRTRDAEAVACAPRNIVAIQPRVVRDQTGIRILVPGDEGFEESIPAAASPAEILQASLDRADDE